MKKFEGEMVRTKIEKFEAIKEILSAQESVDKELVQLCDNEIAIINKKSAQAKSKKLKDQADEYAELEAKVMALFDEKDVIFNDDIKFIDSTSKKTTVMKRLINAGKVQKVDKVKSKDKVSYSKVVG